VAGRLAADGVEIEAQNLDDLPEIDASVAAVAVCLVHSDIEPRHEQAVADALRARGHEVVCSHEVSPEFREYERTVTTVIDAALRPVCRSYLHRLATLAPTVRVMTSAGGLIDVDAAAEHPVALLVSDRRPARGGRSAVAAANGFTAAVSFDMGGTSTDVCLIVAACPSGAVARRAVPRATTVARHPHDQAPGEAPSRASMPAEFFASGPNLPELIRVRSVMAAAPSPR
jgi:N-methylhydantoinase A/oxoprolinase/acetone carboxylase beta subunit